MNDKTHQKIDQEQFDRDYQKWQEIANYWDKLDLFQEDGLPDYDKWKALDPKEIESEVKKIGFLLQKCERLEIYGHPGSMIVIEGKQKRLLQGYLVLQERLRTIYDGLYFFEKLPGSKVRQNTFDYYVDKIEQLKKQILKEAKSGEISEKSSREIRYIKSMCKASHDNNYPASIIFNNKTIPYSDAYHALYKDIDSFLGNLDVRLPNAHHPQNTFNSYVKKVDLLKKQIQKEAETGKISKETFQKIMKVQKNIRSLKSKRVVGHIIYLNETLLTHDAYTKLHLSTELFLGSLDVKLPGAKHPQNTFNSNKRRVHELIHELQKQSQNNHIHKATFVELQAIKFSFYSAINSLKSKSTRHKGLIEKYTNLIEDINAFYKTLDTKLPDTGCPQNTFNSYVKRFHALKKELQKQSNNGRINEYTVSSIKKLQQLCNHSKINHKILIYIDSTPVSAPIAHKKLFDDIDAFLGTLHTKLPKRHHPQNTFNHYIHQWNLLKEKILIELSNDNLLPTTVTEATKLQHIIVKSSSPSTKKTVIFRGNRMNLYKAYRLLWNSMRPITKKLRRIEKNKTPLNSTTINSLKQQLSIFIAPGEHLRKTKVDKNKQKNTTLSQNTFNDYHTQWKNIKGELEKQRKKGTITEETASDLRRIKKACVKRTTEHSETIILFKDKKLSKNQAYKQLDRMILNYINNLDVRIPGSNYKHNILKSHQRSWKNLRIKAKKYIQKGMDVPKDLQKQARNLYHEAKNFCDSYNQAAESKENNIFRDSYEKIKQSINDFFSTSEKAFIQTNDAINTLNKKLYDWINLKEIIQTEAMNGEILHETAKAIQEIKHICQKRSKATFTSEAFINNNPIAPDRAYADIVRDIDYVMSCLDIRIPNGQTPQNTVNAYIAQLHHLMTHLVNNDGSIHEENRQKIVECKKNINCFIAPGTQQAPSTMGNVFFGNDFQKISDVYDNINKTIEVLHEEATGNKFQCTPHETFQKWHKKIASITRIMNNAAMHTDQLDLLKDCLMVLQGPIKKAITSAKVNLKKGKIPEQDKKALLTRYNSLLTSIQKTLTDQHKELLKTPRISTEERIGQLDHRIEKIQSIAAIIEKNDTPSSINTDQHKHAWIAYDAEIARYRKDLKHINTTIGYAEKKGQEKLVALYKKALSDGKKKFLNTIDPLTKKLKAIEHKHAFDRPSFIEKINKAFPRNNGQRYADYLKKQGYQPLWHDADMSNPIEIFTDAKAVHLTETSQPIIKETDKIVQDFNQGHDHKTISEKHNKPMVDGSLQENMASIPQKQQIMSYRFKNTGQSYTAGSAATMPIMPGGSGYWNYVVVGAFDDFVQLPAKTWDFTAPKVASGFKTLKGALVLDGPANGFNMSDVVVMMAIDNHYVLGNVIKNGQNRRYAGDIVGFMSGAVTMHAELAYRSGGADLMRYRLGFHHIKDALYTNRSLLRQYSVGAGMFYTTAKVAGIQGTKAAITYTAVKAGVAAKTVGAPVAIFYVAALGPQFFQSNAFEIIDGKEVPMKQAIDWTKPMTDPASILNIRGVIKAIKDPEESGRGPVNADPSIVIRDTKLYGKLVKEGLQHRCHTIEDNTQILYFSRGDTGLPAFSRLKADKKAVKILIGQ